MKRLHQILSESYRLLLEYDIEKTKKAHGEKALKVALARKDEHGDAYLRDVHGLHSGTFHTTLPGTSKENATHELISQFEEGDPTPQKKYVQHIARIYGNGGYNRHEDVFSRGKDALEKFHDLSTRKVLPQEHRDIGKIKSLDQLEDLVDAHADKLSGKEESKSHHEAMKSQATITEHGSFTHIIPHTAEASKHFGKGTKWCTAAKNNNMHDSYAHQGPLQQYVPKEPKYPGEKYQYHYSTGQLMNEQDKAVTKTGHPDIDNHIAAYEREADHAHQSTAGFDHPEGIVRRKTLAKHWDSATSEQVGKTMEKGLYDSYSEDRFAEDDIATEQPRMAGMGKSPLEHPNATPEQVGNVFLNHKDWSVRASTLWYGGDKKLTQDHYDKFIDQTHPSSELMQGDQDDLDHNPHEMRQEVFERTKNPKHFEYAMNELSKAGLDNDEDEAAILGAARNKSLPAEHAKTILKHPDYGHIAAGNPNLSNEDLEWAAKNHPNSNARTNAKHYLDKREAKATKKNQSGIIWHGR